jgi:hypothetical protein
VSNIQAIVDRVEIEALRGEFTDARMMRDHDRFASLFTPDGAWRMPHIDVELVGREEIRAGIGMVSGTTSCTSNPLRCRARRRAPRAARTNRPGGPTASRSAGPSIFDITSAMLCQQFL